MKTCDGISASHGSRVLDHIYAVPQGALRITAPVELGGTLLPQVLSAFKKLYPAVQIEVILADRTVDLVSEGIDVALRAGELKDSSLISKKLGSIYFAPFASPKYLKVAGHPKNPKELKDHHCLQFTALGTQGWTLNGPKGNQTVYLIKPDTATACYCARQSCCKTLCRPRVRQTSNVRHRAICSCGTLQSFDLQESIYLKY